MKLCLKKGDPELLENYRPLSRLSIFLKIFELVEYTIMVTDFKNGNVLANVNTVF